MICLPSTTPIKRGFRFLQEPALNMVINRLLRVMHASAVALVLLATGLPASAQDDGSVLIDRVVAIVEDDAIMRSELFDRVEILKRQLLSRAPAQIREEDLFDQRVLTQVLERLILERLQLQQAQRQGIRVDDLTLNEAMLSVARDRQQNLEEFRDQLVATGINYVNFREQVRNEIVIARLHKRQIETSVQVSDQEVDDLITSRSEVIGQPVEYRIAHILVAVPDAASPEQVQTARTHAAEIRERLEQGADFTQMAIAESKGQNALEGGDLGWRKLDELPSIFTRAVSLMEVGDISKLIRSASGFHIVKLVERKGESTELVEQTKVRHILIKPNALVNDNDARDRLAALKERVVGGDSFEALAKAHSDDTGSAAEGGDLGWVDRGSLAKEFEDVMVGLAPNEISEPFQTQFGWHIAQVMERRKQDQTQQLLREQARELIRQRKAEEELNLWLRKLRDEHYVEYRLGEGEPS